MLNSQDKLAVSLLAQAQLWQGCHHVPLPFKAKCIS